MIAEKASDMIREKDTVKPIKEYFKHLIAVKHQKFVEEDDEHHEHHRAVHGDVHPEEEPPEEQPARKYKKHRKHL